MSIRNTNSTFNIISYKNIQPQICNPYFKKELAIDVLNKLDQTNYHLFGHDIIYKNKPNKIVKNFHIFNYEQIYNVVKNKKKHFYEHYTNSEPIKFFIDIDCKLTSESKYTNIDHLVDDILLFINPILHKLGHEKSPIIVLNASTTEKLSAHIIFPTIIFKSALHIKELLLNIEVDTNNFIYNKILDICIYRTGCFRLLWCSKLNKNNILNYHKSFYYNYTSDKQLFIDCLLLNLENTNQIIDFELNNDNCVEINNKIHKLKGTNNLVKNINKTISYKNHNNFTVYEDITDDKIINILKELPNEYLNDYDKWIIVLNVLKGLDKWDIFNEWSSKSEKYNLSFNKELWNSTISFLDINHLIFIINNHLKKNTIKYFKSYKKYDPITIDIQKHNFDIISGNDHRVSNILLDNHFENYDNIIIKSDTGTGKTFVVNKLIAKYNDIHKDNKLQIISIGALISLISQHIESFKDLKLKSYQNKFKIDDNIAICINSLIKLEDIDIKQLNNICIYIDEISSFLLLTHNSTLDSTIKRVFSLLTKMIKNCKKLIVSDAFINDQVFDLFNLRNDKKGLYVVNNHINYNNINAIKINNKTDIDNKLIHNIKNKQYFIFASDSATIAEEHYNLCKSNSTEPDDFIIITRNHKFDINNVSQQWKNKFVFYSPSIVYGIDFSIDDKTDVFLYIKGQSISVPLLFQQATRCRNIKNLYYAYNSDIKNNSFKSYKIKYSDYDDCIKQISNWILTNNKLNGLSDMSTYLDENDNIQVVNNFFFKLFCRNEYMFDCYRQNIKFHFESLLKNKGFVLCEYDENISKYKIIITKNNNDNYNEELFKEYINDECKTYDIYSDINKKINILNLPKDKNILTKYKDLIIDDNKFNEHLDIIRFLKSDQYINNKLNELKQNTYDVKTLTNIYNKISLLRKLMNHYNINYFKINNKPDLSPIKLIDDWFLYVKVFRIHKDKPTNIYEMICSIIMMIKHITNSNMIVQKRINIKNLKYNQYDFNWDLIKKHIELNEYNGNSYLDGYIYHFLNIKHSCDVFIDDN